MSTEREAYLDLQEAGGVNPNAVSDELQGQYRSVYSGLSGIHVLADQLQNMGLFAMLDGSAEQTAGHNCAINMLCRVGVLKLGPTGKVSQKDMEAIVTALWSVSR